MVENVLLEKCFSPEILLQNHICIEHFIYFLKKMIEHFLWIEKHLLDNSFAPKSLIKIYSGQKYSIGKSFSLEILLKIHISIENFVHFL